VNRDEIKGKIEKVKGDVKQRIGGARRDRKTEGEGWIQEKKGQVQEKIGELEKESDRREPGED
jgi:uncharacterized protein YjbJ (UPF0337 family)